MSEEHEFCEDCNDQSDEESTCDIFIICYCEQLKFKNRLKVHDEKQ